jgi:hypothetical protein
MTQASPGNAPLQWPSAVTVSFSFQIVSVVSITNKYINEYVTDDNKTDIFNPDARELLEHRLKRG